jgi:hypothetical protein
MSVSGRKNTALKESFSVLAFSVSSRVSIIVFSPRTLPSNGGFPYVHAVLVSVRVKAVYFDTRILGEALVSLQHAPRLEWMVRV